MDEFDKKILRLIQQNGGLSTSDLGERVGLSAMPVWRRLKRFQTEGFIKATVSLLNRKKVGISVTAFVMLRTRQHDKEWFSRLLRFVETETSIIEFHRMSGEIDFMLRVVLRDMDDYREFYNKLIGSVDLLDVSTSFAFETLKETTEIPVR